MSGASTLNATDSNVSMTFTSMRATIVKIPPILSPSRNGIGGPPTPGNRSSGRSSPASAAACASRRRSSSATTTAVSAAGSPASGIDGPPLARVSAK